MCIPRTRDPPPHNPGRALDPAMKYWNWCILRLGLSFLVNSTLIISVQAVPYTPLSFAHLNANIRSCVFFSEFPIQLSFVDTLLDTSFWSFEDQRYCFSPITCISSTFNLHYPLYALLARQVFPLAKLNRFHDTTWSRTYNFPNFQDDCDCNAFAASQNQWQRDSQQLIQTSPSHRLSTTSHATLFYVSLIESRASPYQIPHPHNYVPISTSPSQWLTWLRTRVLNSFEKGFAIWFFWLQTWDRLCYWQGVGDRRR